MFKNKLFIFTPLIALTVVFIFSLTLFPSIHPEPKNLPIAMVIEDQGVDIPEQLPLNVGKQMVKMIQKTSKADKDPVVKWVKVASKEKVHEGLNNQKYYAALVIPKDFSKKQASLKTRKPTSPELQIYINQGMNMAAAGMASNILNGVVDNMNNQVQAQLLQGLESQNGKLDAKQVSKIINPISKKVTNVNEVGDKSANGNAPISLFQPLWIASMATATIIFIAMSKISITSRKETLALKGGQILMGAVAAIIIGFGLTWLANSMVGLHIPKFLDMAVFLTITSFSFIMMISAVLSLVRLKGIAVFALLLFFGAPLLALAPEMMSPFYQNWIYSWLPMRFMVEGLRKILFFGEGFTWNFDVIVLVGIAVVSMLILLGTAFKRHTR